MIQWIQLHRCIGACKKTKETASCYQYPVITRPAWYSKLISNINITKYWQVTCRSMELLRFSEISKYLSKYRWSIETVIQHHIRILIYSKLTIDISTMQHRYRYIKQSPEPVKGPFVPPGTTSLQTQLRSACHWASQVETKPGSDPGTGSGTGSGRIVRVPLFTDFAAARRLFRW